MRLVEHIKVEIVGLCVGGLFCAAWPYSGLVILIAIPAIVICHQLRDFTLRREIARTRRLEAERDRT